jgi:hypothetical protein
MAQGQQPHIPTAAQRLEVETLAGYGVTQDDIALIIGITTKPLRAHYRTELDRGKATANAKMGQNLFQMGMNGNVAAAIFWAKSQMGWSEKQRIDVQQLDANGNPCDPGRLHVTVELLGDPAPVRIGAPKTINAQSYAEAVELIG